MQYNNEADILKALGMESWRNLSKDKLVQFLAMMPEMDKEVALKAISQFPEFTKFARSALEDTTKALEAALDSNERSQAQVHEIHLERLAILKAELDKDLTPDERMRVLDDIREVGEKSAAKDAENKEFLAEQFTVKAITTVATVLALLVFVGARVLIQGGASKATV